MSAKRHFHYYWIAFFIILAFILFWADMTVGAVKIPFSQVFRILFTGNEQSTDWYTIHLFRLPRAVTSLLAGIALSVSGLQMQTVFRNPLAGPYVLGISSGASLGVALVVIGFSGMFSGNIFSSAGSWLLIIAAWAGSAFVLVVILLVSIRVRDIMTILILGIMFGSGISAVISILQYFSSESALKAFVIWTMGSVSNVSRDQVLLLAGGVIIGLILSVFTLKSSNAVLLGENYARTLGINITLYRILTFLSTSILTGTVTAFCGPIGFIGIAVPHICRMILQTSNQVKLFITSIFAGGSLMIFSDIVSQLPGSSMMLPINAVTSLIGIPVVIWIIMRKKKR